MSLVTGRSDEYRQRVVGLALSSTTLLPLTVERPLRRRDDGKLAPAGQWAIRAEQRAVARLARLAPAAGGGPVAPSATPAEPGTRPVEALPASVRNLLAGGELVQSAILLDNHTEDIRAASIGADLVVAVKAQRERRGNQAGPWELDVWRAELDARRALTGAEPGAQRALAGAARPSLQRG
jgi:hypothetical protein